MPASRADQLRWYRTQANYEASEAYLDKLVAEAPPLTADQRARLSVLLRHHTNPPNALSTPAPSTQVAA